MFALKPINGKPKPKAKHLLIVALLGMSVIATTIAFPTWRAIAAPAGTSATITSPTCGSDASIILVNGNSQRLEFDLWVGGEREPVASFDLAAGTTSTIAKRISKTSEQLTVRVGSAAIAVQTVNRASACGSHVMQLPDTTEGISATLHAGSACDETVTAILNNGTSATTKFEVTINSQVRESVVLRGVAAISAALEFKEAGQVFKIVADGKELASFSPQDPGQCDLPIQNAVAPQDVGPWGLPVFFDDFDQNALSNDQAKGWSVYNSPNGKTRRTPDAIRMAESESGTGELQVVGLYDKAKGTHIGGGVSQRYNQKYGRWEVRARTDKGAGFAPIILLWPETGGWPIDGEIDLLEAPRGDRKNAIAVIHNGWGNYFRSKGITGDHSQWHTYAVEWTPKQVTFFVDGVEQWTVKETALIPTTSPMHIVFQNDAGCGWIQCPNASTTPETVMHIDWVKVYELPSSSN